MKKKRCQAISPASSLRCQLNREHIRAVPGHPASLHRKGDIIWGYGGLMPEHNRAAAMEHIPPGDLDQRHVPETAEQRFHVEPKDPEEQLRAWWFEMAEVEVSRTVPKAVEYSATDLADIGHQLARTASRVVSDEEAAELGVFFYLQGKLSRWAGAVAAGQRPSDDTIFDIGVYCRMAQRIRHAGNWPGVNLTDENDLTWKPEAAE